MLEVFRKFGSIQFDPLAVAGRNHDLVLHARVADYDPGWCDLLYERRTVFEAYNKGLSLVPTSEFAWFRATLSRNAPRILAENAEGNAVKDCLHQERPPTRQPPRTHRPRPLPASLGRRRLRLARAQAADAWPA